MPALPPGLAPLDMHAPAPAAVHAPVPPGVHAPAPEAVHATLHVLSPAAGARHACQPAVGQVVAARAAGRARLVGAGARLLCRSAPALQARSRRAVVAAGAPPLGEEEPLLVAPLTDTRVVVAARARRMQALPPQRPPFLARAPAAPLPRRRSGRPSRVRTAAAARARAAGAAGLAVFPGSRGGHIAPLPALRGLRVIAHVC